MEPQRQSVFGVQEWRCGTGPRPGPRAVTCDVVWEGAQDTARRVPVALAAMDVTGRLWGWASALAWNVATIRMVSSRAATPQSMPANDVGSGRLGRPLPCSRLGCRGAAP